MSNFNYDSIPQGHYDKILDNGSAIRRFWHWHKFNSVARSIIDSKGKTCRGSILDIGCFAGSFLKTIDAADFPQQLGIDILANQIAYAQEKYGTSYRRFLHVQCFDDAYAKLHDHEFDVITIIEVIEHLAPHEVAAMLKMVARTLRPGGTCVITTPNYTSIWPLLEFYLNYFSDLSYEEQHITKFTYLNFFPKLATIYPELPQHFTCSFKTTTHFLTPFLAPISYQQSQKISRLITPKNWSFPFGPLILAKLTRNT